MLSTSTDPFDVVRASNKGTCITFERHEPRIKVKTEMTGFEVERCLEVRFETHGKFQAEVTEVEKIKARDEVEAAIRKARLRVLNASKQLTSLESIRKSHFAQARTMHKEQFTWKPAVVSVSRAMSGWSGWQQRFCTEVAKTAPGRKHCGEPQISGVLEMI